MKRSSSVKNSAGFTLLEVMVALTIVSIVLVAMLGLSQRQILINSHLQQMTRATLLAKQKMAEIETGQITGLSQTQGAFAPPNQEFSWEVSYTPTPIPGVSQVDLSVVWGDKQENELVTLSSFLQDVQ